MKSIQGLFIAILGCLAICALAVSTGGRSKPSGRDEIEKFNENYLQLHLKMDTPGIFALWADDGVDLLPGEAPLIGKKAIRAWVDNVIAKMPGAKVTKQEMQFHDIQVSGDWASEWALEHQVVELPDGKEPVESWGKMALVLHRDATGQWKVQQEMWNGAPKQ